MIVHVKQSSGLTEPNHFFVVMGATDEKVQIIDGYVRPRWIEKRKFEELFQGWSLLVAPNRESFSRAVSSNRRFDLLSTTITFVALSTAALFLCRMRTGSKNRGRGENVGSCPDSPV